MVFSNSFSYVDCAEMPAYPEISHYHDWRDALYQLDGFPMQDGELFDINHWKTKIGAIDDLQFGIFLFVRSFRDQFYL